MRKVDPNMESGIKRFIFEKCLTGEGLQVKFAEFSAAYRFWCEENDLKPAYKTTLGECLTQLGFKKATHSKYAFRTHLALKPKGTVPREGPAEYDVVEVPPEVREAFDAARKGDLKAVQELQANGLAFMTVLCLRELQMLSAEGLAMTKTIVGSDGKARKQNYSNPRTDAVLRLSRLIGFGASEQKMTPASAEVPPEEGKESVAEFMSRMHNFGKSGKVLKMSDK